MRPWAMTSGISSRAVLNRHSRPGINCSRLGPRMYQLLRDSFQSPPAGLAATGLVAAASTPFCPLLSKAAWPPKRSFCGSNAASEWQAKISCFSQECTGVCPLEGRVRRARSTIIHRGVALHQGRSGNLSFITHTGAQLQPQRGDHFEYSIKTRATFT